MGDEAYQGHVLTELSKLNDQLFTLGSELTAQLVEIDKKIDVRHAAMPADYVPRTEYTQNLKEQKLTRRYVVTTALALLATIVAGAAIIL